MSNLSSHLWLIPGLPLIASAVIAFLGPKFLRQHSHWPCILALVGSCILSVIVLTSVPSDPKAPQIEQTCYTWIKTGQPEVTFDLPRDKIDVTVSFRADALTAVMLVTVTFIGTLIAIYSVGYMHGDEGYPRFFALVSLFIFSMTGLVLADNFLLLYAFWEGVGLCSYLLIGFWYSKPSAAAAARKAFLVTRLGDIGLMLGIIIIWIGFKNPDDGGPLAALDFKTVLSADVILNPRNNLTLVCLLLFCGAVGKSAQFPLHVWLPDAMEGPTPVSALIHAATMVTAGVYLVARCTPMFQYAPEANLVVACIGGFTALLAALIALTQNDLKRVLAYSTISQLGYMFLALGSGAVVAAIFHLFTHAFFKALLFLAAGSVMHSMGNVIDMRRFGGLRRILPVTHLTFLCGAASLAAFPFITAGFWSKDEIIGGVFRAGQGQSYPYVYGLLFITVLITAGLTAFYTFRAYFLTFWGPEKVPSEAGHHAHESPRVMTVPLMVLAGGAILAGFVNAEPFTHALGDFLHHSPNLEVRTPVEPVGWGERLLLWLGSISFALGGIAVAWWMYYRDRSIADRVREEVPWFYQLSLNKFYLDELYNAFIVRPMAGFAEFCRVFDQHLLDGLVDLVGHVPRMLGQVFRPVQNGLVQFYALAMVLGLLVFLLARAGWF